MATVADETRKGAFPKKSGETDSIILELYHILWYILHSHIIVSLELSNRNTLETDASDEGRLCAGIIYKYVEQNIGSCKTQCPRSSKSENNLSYWRNSSGVNKTCTAPPRCSSVLVMTSPVSRIRLPVKLKPSVPTSEIRGQGLEGYEHWVQDSKEHHAFYTGMFLFCQI